MKAHFSCSHVAAISACVPRQSVDLAQFKDVWGENEVAQIIANTGITRIRQAPENVTTADLCVSAAEALFAATDVDPQSIDGIVFVSQTPDYVMPATSAVLQHRLGLGRETVAFDINYGCSGYIYGLLQADMLIHSGMCRSVLVLAGDTTTHFVNPRDRALRMLFGDGGSATLVLSGGDQHSYAVRTDGSGAKSLIIPAGGARQKRDGNTCVARAAEDGNFRSDENLFMDGIAVLFMALRDAPETIGEALALAQWQEQDVTFYGLHQANRFMIEYLARKMKTPPEVTPFACKDIGNTGPASIPVMLANDQARSQDPGRYEKSVLCGFGVGFSVAALTLPLDTTRILDLVERD